MTTLGSKSSSRISVHSSDSEGEQDDAFAQFVLNRNIGNHTSDEDYHLPIPSYIYPHTQSNQEANSTDKTNISTNMPQDNEVHDVSYRDQTHIFNEGTNRSINGHDSISPVTPEFNSEMVGSLSNSKVKSTFFPQIISNIASNLETSVMDDDLLQFLNATRFQNAGELIGYGSYHEEVLKKSELLSILNSKEKIEVSQLHTNIETHKKTLSSGKSPVNIRANITSNLQRLTQVFQLLYQFYNHEVSTRGKIIESFEAWERRKVEMSHKIEDIDKTIIYNDKLQTLVDQRKSVASEIEILENRLQTLKHKANLIDEEISSTRSVVESEKASYVRSIEHIDKVEYQAIDRLVKENYISLDEIHGKSLPIEDVPLSKRNVVDNLKLAFNKFGRNVNIRLNADEVLGALYYQQQQLNSSRKHYQKCVNDFDQITNIWFSVVEELNAKEETLYKLFMDVQTSQKSITPRTTFNDSIEQILTGNMNFLQSRIQVVEKLNANEANVSEVFGNVLRNELAAIVSSLQLVNPTNSLLHDVGTNPDERSFTGFPHNHALLSSSPDSKSMVSLSINDNFITNNVLLHKTIDRPSTPVLPINPASSSPPAASLITTYASEISSGGNGGLKDSRAMHTTSSLIQSKYKNDLSFNKGRSRDKKALKKD